MKHTRKKLIGDLIRVSRLIEPAPTNQQGEHRDIERYDASSKLGRKDFLKVGADFGDIPVVKEVVDHTYVARDMFTTDEKLPMPANVPTRKSPQLTGEISDSQKDEIEPPKIMSISKTEAILDQPENNAKFPVHELARELVVLIDDLVSRRSGEHLDDAFRDELTEGVTTELQNWLNYN